MHKAYNLISLINNLNSIEGKEQLISFFLKEINSIYSDLNLTWNSTIDSDSLNSFEISTSSNSYGYFLSNAHINLEDKSTIKETVNILAFFIDNQKEKETIKNLKTDLSKLKKSESYFKNIFNESAVGKSITSIDNKVHINDAFCKMLGYSKSELEQKHWNSFTHLDDIEENVKILKEIIDGKKSKANWEKRFISKKGKIIWTKIQTTLIRDKNNKPLHFITSIIDISELKNANIKIAEGEKRLANIIDGTRAGTWEWNVQTGETKFNEMWANIIGYTLNEIEPVTIETWLKFAHPDDLEKSNELLQQHFKRQTDHYEFESRMKHKNGSWVWVLDRGKVSKWSSDGKPLLMYGTHQDITERKNAEIALKDSENLLNQSQKVSLIGSYTMDIKKGIWQSSNMLNEIFGIDDSFPRTVEGWTDLIHPDNHAQMSNYLINEVFEKRNRFDKEYQIISKKDKKVKWVHGIGELEYNKSNEPIRMIGTIQDISERRKTSLLIQEKNKELIRTNKKLKKAKIKAEKSDHLKTSFLTNMSHEIRTPLNSIMGFSSLLPDEEAPESIAKYSNIIVQNSEQLVSIIDGIVLYSKLQTGLLKCFSTEFSINKLIEDVYQSFDLPEFKQKTSLIIHTTKENINVFNDYDKVRQVLTNLISNAFKYTPSGKIDVSFISKDRTIEFIIMDTGIGIPSKEKKRIFERFYRGSNVEMSKTRGTGLGLSIVKELVELLGGTIKVKSKTGEGTTFSFTIKKKR